MSRFNLSKSGTAHRSFVLSTGQNLVIYISPNRNYIAYLSPHANEFASGVMWKGQRITSLCNSLVKDAEKHVKDLADAVNYSPVK